MDSATTEIYLNLSPQDVIQEFQAKWINQRLDIIRKPLVFFWR